MLDLQPLLQYFPIQLPDYALELAKTYTPDPVPMPLVSEEEFQAVQNATQMDESCFDTLRKVNAKLFEDKDRNTAARFLRAVLFELRSPWENYIYASPSFTIPDVPTGTTELLFVTAALGYTLTVRKPPEDLNLENINAYKGYTRNFTEQNGYWGIGQYNWNLLCAGGCMFLFNSLKFQPEQFSGDFLVITNGKEYKTLMKTDFNVESDGSLTNRPERTAFRTTFTETDEAFIAHEIAPNGAVAKEATTFDKNTWSVFLSREDMVLGFHIPSNKPYTPEEHRISMQQAMEFYKKFYPKTNFKAFVCYSWLYSVQNKFLFEPTSKILEIQKCVHLCPMSTELDENLGFIRKGSSLQQRIADYRAAGNSYRVGFMYIPADEAEHFGTHYHEL